MNSIQLSGVVFFFASGGAILGLFLRRILPGHHLDEDAKDAVKLGAGLVATLAALVLGLLISSAKESYNIASDAVTQTGAKVIFLDRTLAHYGPETRNARETLRHSLVNGIHMFWLGKVSGQTGLKAFEKGAGLEQVQDQIRGLAPQSDSQRWLQSQALQLTSELLQLRWSMIERAQVSLPMVFIVILMFWIFVLFVIFGMMASRNATVVVVFLVCAFAVASAMFLILEMNTPLEGAMKIEKTPLVKALELIGK